MLKHKDHQCSVKALQRNQKTMYIPFCTYSLPLLVCLCGALRISTPPLTGPLTSPLQLSTGADLRSVPVAEKNYQNLPLFMHVEKRVIRGGDVQEMERHSRATGRCLIKY
jgi:hypothetical protein